MMKAIKYSGIFPGRPAVMAAVFLAVAVLPLHAAYIGYVYPAGARQGSRVTLLFGGLGLYSAKNVVVTGGGVEAVEVEVVQRRPTAGRVQGSYLRQWVRKILAGKDKSAPPKPEDTRDWGKCIYWDTLDQLDENLFEIVMRSLYIRRNALQDSPALRQLVLVTLDVAPDAAPGRREIRLLCSGAASNPLPFYVSKVPEVREPRYLPPGYKAKVPEFTFPSVLNGQIMPGETDTFTFRAKRKEKFSFVLKGRSLVPFIGDGVPGHFQPVLEITDTKGKPLAFADDWFHDPDPKLNFTAPGDGIYMLKVRDALYRGREDFVYRVEASRGFFRGVDSSYPISLQRKPYGVSAPVVQAADWDGRKLPGEVILEGKFKSGKSAYSFKFEAEKDQTLVFESFARRVGSPADTRLTISKDGKTLAVSDDLKELRVGICYQQADSYIAFKAPEKGEYTVTLSEVSGKGSGSHFFYLRAADTLRPSMSVYITPSSVSLPIYASVVVTAHVIRRDGLNGEIKLRMEPNVIAEIAGSAVIPAGATQAKITIKGKPLGKNVPSFFNQSLSLAACSGKVEVKVIGGDEMMQAFAYTHINPAAEILALRTRLYKGVKSMKDINKIIPSRLTMKPGESKVFRIRHSVQPAGSGYEFSLIDAPTGVSCSTARVNQSQHTLTITAAADAKAAVANMIVMVKYYQEKKDKNGKMKKSSESFALPAVRMEIK